MPTLVSPTADESQALELLQVARSILLCNRDQDRIEKVTLLQEYLELSVMFPERDYRVVIRKTIAGLSALVHQVPER